MADNHDIILDEIKELKRRVEYLEKALVNRPVYIPYPVPPEPYQGLGPLYEPWVVTCENKHC